MLNDKAIQTLCTVNSIFQEFGVVEKVTVPLINPFSEGVQGEGIISYGLTSAGYDLRLDNEEVLIFKNSYGHEVDPKRFKDKKYKEELFDIRSFAAHDKIIIPPHGYILTRSYEYIHVPKFLKGRVTGKSTYARCGIVVNCTPLEPEWEGHLTIEISNSSPCPAVLYALEGIAQLELELLCGTPKITYKTKKGQYDKQIGVTCPMVK